MTFQYISKKKVLLLLGDVAVIVLALLSAPTIKYGIFVFEPGHLWPEIFVILTVYLLSFYVADLYNFESSFLSAAYLFRFFIAYFTATGIMMAIDFLAPRFILGRGVFVITSFLILLFASLWRLSIGLVLRRLMKDRKRSVLIIGAGKLGHEIYNLLSHHPDLKVGGFISEHSLGSHNPEANISPGQDHQLEEIVNNGHIDQIIVAMKEIADADLIKRLLSLKMSGVEVYSVPTFYEQTLGKIYVEHLNDIWFLNMHIHGVKKTIYNRRIKRLGSVFISLGLLVITGPVLLLSALAIKLDSRGPVFYRQKRVGLNGKTFEILKFRTMKVGMEQKRQFAGHKDDPRITRVGKILRRSRIDEIPQIWNVLKGEMSMIGPRALMVEEIREFENKVPFFSIRHTVKPGITGWAQVNYPHGATAEDALEKLKYDLFYVKNLSPLLDFHILLRTLRVVMFRKGAK